MSSKSRKGPNPYKRQERMLKRARKQTKLRWGIYLKERDKWELVDTFTSEKERDDYYRALVELNPDAELRRVDL